MNEVIAALIGGGVISSILTYIFTRPKMKADTAATQVATAMNLMNDIKKEYEAMRKAKISTECEVVQLKSDLETIKKEFIISMAESRKERDGLIEKNTDLEERVAKLEAQLESLGEQPVTKRKRKTDT